MRRITFWTELGLILHPEDWLLEHRDCGFLTASSELKKRESEGYDYE